MKRKDKLFGLEIKLLVVLANDSVFVRASMLMSIQMVH